MQLADLFMRDVDASDPAARDPEFIRTVALPFFNALRVRYFRAEIDGLKSFWRRHTIDFHGRTGFVRLALEHGVPILPVVDVGGHEVYITLLSSQRLARWTGMSRWTRVKTVPVNLGLPWGVWATGFLPYLPLPAKFVYRVGPPIDLGHDPDAARDERAVRSACDRVRGIREEMMDDLAERRRLPVFG